MTRPTHVLFVCLGNICRSPLAEGVAGHVAHARGVSDRFVFDSAGTSGEHDGEAPHPGSVRVARERGIDICGQRSRRITRADLDRFDVIVAMDRSNRRNVERLGGFPAERLLLQRDFEQQADVPDVPDPWSYGAEAYRAVYDILVRSMPGLLNEALTLGPRADGPSTHGSGGRGA